MNGFDWEYIPTVFDNTTIDHTAYNLQMRITWWDTAAGNEYRDLLRSLSYHDTDLFVLFFSISNRESFSGLAKWMEEVKPWSSPVLLAGTKSDLRKQDPTNQIPRAEIEREAQNLGVIGYVECSAFQFTGIRGVVDAAITHLKEVKKKSKKHEKCKLM